jgi:ParB family chromosome partitioning protein
VSGELVLTAPPAVLPPKPKKSKKGGNVLHSSESVDYYTPSIYVEAARAVMGGIDLDPASCEEANQIVKATKFFTIEDDGLSLEWFGKVWLNMPYGKRDGKSNQGLWTERAIRAYRARKIEQAVALMNATPDRGWFQPFWEHDVCLTDHRIEFLVPGGATKDDPTHGNAFLYLGPNGELFARMFRRFGAVIPAGAAILAQP